MNSPIRTNPKLVAPAHDKIDGTKLLQRADVVWSRLTLEPDEVLLVKLSRHMANQAKEIQQLIDTAFGKDNDRIIIYVAGDIEFTKVKA